MPLIINMRHLEAHNLSLEGQLPVAELDIDTRDELIRLASPLEYQLEVQQLEDSLLVEGSLSVTLDCQCVRCLKPVKYPLNLDPWTCHLPLEGEEATPVINDCVDLTPYIREDILLEFPLHPLCKAECPGLPKPKNLGRPRAASSASQPQTGSPAWSDLNKLKF